MVAYDDDEVLRAPIAAEVVTVTKRVGESGRVRVGMRVDERQELVEAALRHGNVAIERVPVGEVVATPPQVRMEGDVLIYPVVEERT